MNKIEKTKKSETKMIPYTVQTYKLGFHIPGSKFWSKNNPQPPPWTDVPIKIVEDRDSEGIRKYPKDFCYPEDNKEYSLEELHAYKWFRSKCRVNSFVTERDPVWKNKLAKQSDTTESEPKANDKNQNTRYTAAIKKVLNKKRKQQIVPENLIPFQPVGSLNHAESMANKSPIIGVSEQLPKLRVNAGSSTQRQSITPTYHVSSSSSTNPWGISSIEHDLDQLSGDKDVNSTTQSNPTSNYSDENSNSVGYTEGESKSTDCNDTIENILQKSQINPFNDQLTQFLLEKINFVDQLKEMTSCTLKESINILKKRTVVECGGAAFTVIKLIGKGAFGAVFSATCNNEPKKRFALKLEQPPNIWEYYICQEVEKRLTNKNLLTGFMTISHALIGKNASILVSELIVHGTLLDICNIYKQKTNHDLNEKLTMMCVSQILDLIHYLHKDCQIIHADIKPDNFLIVGPIRDDKVFIKLIDFGIAIDMKLLNAEKPGIKFVKSAGHGEKDPSIEMREGKPWTYQLDFYGIAGVTHVLLFMKYIEVEKYDTKWRIKQKLPRYISKRIWELFFDTLLNIPSSRKLPSLMSLKQMLNLELEKKKKVVSEKIKEFNNILLLK